MRNDAVSVTMRPLSVKPQTSGGVWIPKLVVPAGTLLKVDQAVERGVVSEEEPSGNEWLTVREYAQHFRVSERTVIRWINTDPNMRARRIGPAGAK
jgi:hypothetical protein